MQERGGSTYILTYHFISIQRFRRKASQEEMASEDRTCGESLSTYVANHVRNSTVCLQVV